MVGISGDVDAHYHDLQNSFIGMALNNEDHPSLPLISVAIYCCLAQRLGLDASPCGFPFHVLAIVRPLEGQSLDDQDSGSALGPQSIYMDPFRSSTETPVERLVTQLVNMGIPRRDHESLLNSSSISEIVTRCAKNIITSVQTLPREPGAGPAAAPKSNVESAFYAALWALVLLPNGDDTRSSRMQQARYLPVVTKHVEAQFPTDIWIMERNFVSGM